MQDTLLYCSPYQIIVGHINGWVRCYDILQGRVEELDAYIGTLERPIFVSEWTVYVAEATTQPLAAVGAPKYDIDQLIQDVVDRKPRITPRELPLPERPPRKVALRCYVFGFGGVPYSIIAGFDAPTGQWYLLDEHE